MSLILALAGRRIDVPGAENPRFALANVPAVRERMLALFRSLDAAGLVCAAACGADLIALELFESLKLHAWIVLPFATDLFRAGSVIDRPGDWGPQYDHQVQLATQAGRLRSHDLPSGDDATYLDANELILDEAMRAAGTAGRVIAVIAWEGVPRPGLDVTHAFAESARERGIAVREISTR